MTVPGRPALIAAGAVAAVLLVAAHMPFIPLAAVVINACIVGLCLLEGRRLKKIEVIVEREGPPRPQLGHESEFIYAITNRSPRAIIASLRQTWPVSFSGATGRVEVRVEPREVVRVGMGATPNVRGRVKLPPLEVDLRRPFGWAVRRWDVPPGEGVTVYPDLEAVTGYETLRRSHALGRFGIHRMRMVGVGREFELLRDYLPDDDYRSINWKATAKRNKPVTNVFQAERSQDVLLCIDCSRMMGSALDSGTVLDKAVDAAAMLAHVVRREGDRVGLVLFKDTVNVHIRPRAGVVAVGRIIDELVEAAAEPVFPSYSAVVEALRARQKRRCMIFLFTDTNDPQLTSDMARVMPLLGRRHVITVVSMVDPALARAASGPASDSSDVHRVLAGRSLLLEREARALDLKRGGVQILEADADSLTMSAINRYLAIKMRQLV